MRDTPLVDDRRSETEIGDPSRWDTWDLDNASLGLMRRAWAEGVPEMVVASPHSQDCSLSVVVALERVVVMEPGRVA